MVKTTNKPTAKAKTLKKVTPSKARSRVVDDLEEDDFAEYDDTGDEQQSNQEVPTSAAVVEKGVSSSTDQIELIPEIVVADDDSEASGEGDEVISGDTTVEAHVDDVADDVSTEFGIAMPRDVIASLRKNRITLEFIRENEMERADWKEMKVPLAISKLLDKMCRCKRVRSDSVHDVERLDDEIIKRARVNSTKIPEKRPPWLLPIQQQHVTDGAIYIDFFEKMMKLHAYPIDTWSKVFLLALPEIGTPEEVQLVAVRDWFTSAFNNGDLETWEKTRTSFLTTFKSTLGRQVNFIDELVSMKQKDETVQNFANRMNTLIIRYGDTTDSMKHQLPLYFIRGLKLECRKALYREMHSAKIDEKDLDWKTVVELATTAEKWVLSDVDRDHNPKSAAASSSSSDVKPRMHAAQERTIFRACVFHPSSDDHSSHTCRIYQRHLAKWKTMGYEVMDHAAVISRIEMDKIVPHPSTRPGLFRFVGKYQGFIAPPTISVPIVRGGDILPRGGGSSRVGGHDQPSTSSSSSSGVQMMMMSSEHQPRIRSQVQCYRCGEYGHIAAECPSPVVSSRGSRGMSRSISHPVQARVDMDLNKQQSGNYFSPYRVLLKIKGMDVRAEIDPGSSHSIIEDDWWEQTNEDCDEIDMIGTAVGIDERGLPNQLQIKKITREVTVFDGRRTVEHRFLVGRTGIEGIDALIGRDLNVKLGYVVIGIPFRILREQQKLLSDADMQGDLRTKACDEHKDRQFIIKSVNGEIEENQRVQGFCTHPESVIQFRLPESVRLPWVPQYPIPEVKRRKVDEAVKNWIANQRVELATSMSTNLPLNGAAKRHPVTGEKSDVRTNYDGRRLNDVLKEHQIMEFPNFLPKIDEVFDRLAGSDVITVLDAADAYPSCEIEESTRKYFQFTWAGQRWQFRGMPFGLHFMTSKFQKLMMTILNEHGSYCMVFVDDIIIFSNNANEHVEQLKAVINTLTQWNLKVKPAKAQIGYRNLFALGHKAGADGIQIDRRKLIGVDNWEKPTARTVEHYLGLFNYFRKFIPQYSVVMEPLERVRKNFSWSEEQERSWSSAKELLKAAPILHFPCWSQRFYLAVDGSKEGLSAVLFQFATATDDREWSTAQKKFIGQDEASRDVKIVAMKSRATKNHERLYSQNKLETASLVYGLWQFHSYLYGREFTVFTDHEALVWLFSKDELNRTLSSWIDLILEYKFEIVHLPGIRNVLPDVLSRIYPVRNMRGDEVVSSRPIKKRKEVDPVFEALPNTSSSSSSLSEGQGMMTAFRLEMNRRYDLSSLNDIQWKPKSLVSARQPRGKQKYFRMRVPVELMNELQKIFGPMNIPDQRQSRGLRATWETMNFVHPAPVKDNIERWFRKGLEESDKRGCTSVFLVPEWRRKKWFEILKRVAQMYFFKYPIRFEPFIEAVEYRSILVIINEDVAKRIRIDDNLRFFRIQVAERIMRSVVTDEAERLRLIKHYHARGHFGGVSLISNHF